MRTLLFVCTANRFRSPIAEACFKTELIERKHNRAWKVSSAGTWTQDGLPAMPDAIQNAEQLGLDIQSHRSRAITAEVLQGTDLILVMERGQKEALQSEFPHKKAIIFLLSEAAENLSYDLPDPVLDPTVGDIAADICSLIRNNYKRIIDLGESDLAIKDLDIKSA